MRKLKPLIAALGIVGSATCVAAPFCVVTSGRAPDCGYFDQNSCESAAAAHRGTCFANTALSARGTQHANSRYCMVLKGGNEQCGFADMAACAKAGTETGGTCVERPRIDH